MDGTTLLSTCSLAKSAYYCFTHVTPVLLTECWVGLPLVQQLKGGDCTIQFSSFPRRCCGGSTPNRTRLNCCWLSVCISPDWLCGVRSERSASRGSGSSKKCWDFCLRNAIDRLGGRAPHIHVASTSEVCTERPIDLAPFHILRLV